MPIDRERFERTRHSAIEALLARRNEAGHWEGELSSSALSTATATVALSMVDAAKGTHVHADLIEGGLRWLREHQNDDGGWGDTIKSFSNISTTMLCWAAMNVEAAQANAETDETVRRAEAWLEGHAGSIEVPDLVEAVMRRYGQDRTFSVPILTMCSLCGRLGDNGRGGAAWRHVKQLPFELAAFPQKFYNRLNLRVVSYALPALIAIGQARHYHRPTANPITRLARQVSRQATLRVLEKIQPSNGGFLEAAPLTSFVTMSLASIGLADHGVTRKGVAFLRGGVRGDGSWPIDTNLATWVTTLSINALAAGGRLDEHLEEDERAAVRGWLIGQQYTEVHPYTGAEPGGWAWTDLPGGVPDADDTSGAVLALCHLGAEDGEASEAIRGGLEWLDGLQNSDGGIPTFCRGWGRLPFDRSSCDITAHYLRACAQAEPLGIGLNIHREHRVQRAWGYLAEELRPDDSWVPLWFGNQHLEREENPTYATSLVALASDDADSCMWLLVHQNADGGWGGGAETPSSVEETALAVSAIADAILKTGDDVWAEDAIERGVNWLIDKTREGTSFDPTPIGFYFAKLWYYEAMYPLVWTVAALERVRKMLEQLEED
ncbi:MAG: prenyltransferase/squalene oxidase repeat-containing protein [Planctomycetota bacterium]|jgi:squalene-hopene/tetraprenyl-beta-curcumene cyclase